MSSQNIILIAAVDRNMALGYKNALNWHLPDDFQHFKNTTKGQIIVVGHATALSLGRPLPNRRNIVLSRSGRTPFPNMESAASIADVLYMSDQKDIYVCGGGEVYAAFMPLATSIILTEIDTEVPQADTWFPKIDLSRWTEVSRLHHPIDDRHRYSFDIVTYTSAPQRTSHEHPIAPDDV